MSCYGFADLTVNGGCIQVIVQSALAKIQDGDVILTVSRYNVVEKILTELTEYVRQALTFTKLFVILFSFFRFHFRFRFRFFILEHKSLKSSSTVVVLLSFCQSLNLLVEIRFRFLHQSVPLFFVVNVWDTLRSVPKT